MSANKPYDIDKLLKCVIIKQSIKVQHLHSLNHKITYSTKSMYQKQFHNMSESIKYRYTTFIPSWANEDTFILATK